MARKTENDQETIIVRLKEIEEELRMLPDSSLTGTIRAQLHEMQDELQALRRRLSKRSTRPAGLADLYGFWKGKSHFTYEEIREAEIRLQDT